MVEKVQYLTTKAVRALFESKPSLQTIRRWMIEGVHNRLVKNGQGVRITLDHIRDGDILLTTLQWVIDFKTACRANRKSGNKT